MTHPALIERITRSLAYMLRHQPEEFDLELDAHGYGDTERVVQALNERLGEPVTLADLEDAIRSGDRPRYEIVGNRVRALYGHSIDVEPGEPSRPPELLFVGISARDADRALQYGLRGGRRRFLHLALTPDDAKEGGRRTGRDYVVITVYALDAWEEGINFYDRKALFLAGQIPTEFLELSETCHDGFETEGRPQGGRREFGGDRGRGGPRPQHAGGRQDDRGRGGRGDRGPRHGGSGGDRGSFGEPAADAPAREDREPAFEEARAEFRPEPRGELRSEPRGELRSEPRGELRSEPRGEWRSEPRGESRSEPRGEFRPEPRGEHRSDARDAERRERPPFERSRPAGGDRGGFGAPGREREGPGELAGGDAGRRPRGDRPDRGDRGDRGGRGPDRRQDQPPGRPREGGYDRPEHTGFGERPARPAYADRPAPDRAPRPAPESTPAAPPQRREPDPGFGLGIFEEPSPASPRASSPPPPRAPAPPPPPPAPPVRERERDSDSSGGFGAGV